MAFRNAWTIGQPQRAGEKPPEKGRPPPGGEEAEVVVYQPRGVGLIHTRHKPGNAHYTHEDVAKRKLRLPDIALENGKTSG